MDTDAVQKILRRLLALVNEDIRKGNVGVRAYQRLAQTFDEGPQKARQDFDRLFGEAVPKSQVDAWRAGEPGRITDDECGYFSRWKSVIESSAVELESADEHSLAMQLRGMTPEPLIDPGHEDYGADWSFDINALRDRVVAMLGDLAEDREASHGLETGGSSGSTSVRKRTTPEEAEASAKRLFYKLWKLNNRTEWGRQIGKELGRNAVNSRTIKKLPSWEQAKLRRDRNAVVGQRLRAHGVSEKIIEQLEDPRGMNIDAIIQRLDDADRKKLETDPELQELFRQQVEDDTRVHQPPDA